MQRVLPSISTEHQQVRSWALPSDRAFFRTMIRQAVSRAEHLGHEVLASVVLPVPHIDPLHILCALRQLSDECVYWEQPAQGAALAGAGIATTIEGTGPERFVQVSTAWRTLQRNIVLAHAPDVTPGLSGGPLLLGGFAFDPLAEHSQMWDGFPNGLLIVPQLLLQRNADGSTLTINRMVQVGDDSERCAEEIMTTLLRLCSAVEMILPPQKTSRGKGELVECDLLTSEEWQKIVADAVRTIRGGAYEKVVLARAVQVT